MTVWARWRTAWQGFKTRRKMNRQFGRRPDPFGYDADPYEKARMDAMEAALGPRPGAVLECGCAEGHFTARLAARTTQVLAIDISEIALARARSRARGARFLEADLLTWAEPEEGSFDAIVLGDVLYYLDRPGVADKFAELFARVASWLKPGGRLILAHGYSGDAELARRRSFRERFEAAGLKLVSEGPIPGPDRDGVRCLLSVLER